MLGTDRPRLDKTLTKMGHEPSKVERADADQNGKLTSYVSTQVSYTFPFVFALVVAMMRSMVKGRTASASWWFWLFPKHSTSESLA